MTIGSYTEEQFGKRLKLFIRPAKPVDEPDMLHGREPQLETIRRSLFVDGRSVFIFGDRGVGKSSLAEIAASQYRDDKKDFLYVQCEDKSTLSSVSLAMIASACRCGGPFSSV
jgi:predicted AAA+ superfamily ATPase